MIYVVRHGETNWNKENRLQGQVESVLTEEGIRQANETKKKLTNVSFDLIICSPLKRCIDTANVINMDRDIPIIHDNRIQERSYGDLEGAYGTEIDIKMLWDLKVNYSGQNVESVKSFFDRCFGFLEEVEAKYKDKNVLLSTHSGNSIAINCFYKGIPEDLDLLKLGLKNCESVCYDKEIDRGEER